MKISKNKDWGTIRTAKTPNNACVKNRERRRERKDKTGLKATADQSPTSDEKKR
jgi:hypothetical protein